MKTILKQLQITVVLAASLLTTHVAFGQTTWFWSGANNVTDTNWSDAANWLDFATATTTGTPAAGDNVIFSSTNDPAMPFLVGNTVMETNAVDANFLSVNSSATINSLFYGFAPVNTTGFYTNGLYTNAAFTTYIASGLTLTVNGSANPDPGNTHNTDTLFVGTGSDWGTNWSVSAQIIGPGATLLVSNTVATVNVYQGSGLGAATFPTPAADIQQRATLDMSGLDTFVASVRHFFVGVQGSVSGGANTATTPGKQSGILYLAKTNFIKLPADGLLLLGESASDGSQSGNRLYLGQTNVIFANAVETGRKKGGYGNLIEFNPSLSGQNPVAYFRGSDGVSPVTTWLIGDDASANSGVNASFGTNDFSAGTVDALVNLMVIGRGQNATSRAAGGGGTLTFSAGQIVVNNLTNGTQGNINASSSGAGTININGAGTLSVTNVLFLGNALGGGGAAGTMGVLNINGGSALINELVSGASLNNSVSVANSASLVLTNESSGTLNTFSITNSHLTLPTTLSGATLTASSLSSGGLSNLVNIGSIPVIGGYPATFKLIQYTTFSGTNNFVLGSLPASTPPFVGYITNDASVSSVNLVLLGGQAPARVLIWDGNADANWNIGSSLDWHTNGASAGSTTYNNLDFVQFDDTIANANTSIALNAVLTPSAITVTNDSKTFTFNNSGSGYLSGSGGITKSGSGTLIIADNGNNNDFSGGVTVNGGTVQVGNSDNNGTLGSGAVFNNGALVFNRNDSATIANAISGSGTVTQNGGGTLTLSGANSFDGSVTVTSSSILQAGNNAALGSTNGGTAIASGSAFDINGKNLGAEPVSVSGTGPDATKGAIYNSAANASPALARLTLTGNTTIGGPVNGLNQGRWDLRAPGGITGDPSTASLSTGGNAYNVTKVGVNLVGIGATTVDPALGDIDVQAGIFAVEGNTTGLGNPANTLTIEGGATLQLTSATNQLNKLVQLSDGAIVVATNGNNAIIGPITLNGSESINVFNGTLMLSNATTGITGSGSMNKNNTGTLIVAGADSHSGGTVVNDGTYILNGISSDPNNTLTENTSQTLSTTPVVVGGNGTNIGPVDIEDTLHPGVGGHPSTFGVGSGPGNDYPGASGTLAFGALASGTPSAIFDLGSSTTVGGGVNDLVVINGDFDGNFAHVKINPLAPLNTSTPYTLITYNGSKGLNFNSAVNLVSGASRYNFTLNYPANAVTLSVSGGPALLQWNNNANNGLWDVNSSQNWNNLTTPGNDVFYNFDAVVLDDSIITAANPLTTLTIPTLVTVSPAVITNNSTTNYTIVGPGKITGSSSIVKMGTSTLTISNANDYTGTVIVSGGTIKMGNSAALGATNGITTVTNGGTLDINGVGFAQENVVLSGPGVNTNGALVNNGVKVLQGAQYVTLAGDTWIGGTGPASTTAGRWDFRSATGGTTNAIISTTGHPYKLVKVGSNEIGLVDVFMDPALGDIDIQNGVLHVEGTTSSLGDPAYTLTVEPGALLGLYSAAVPLDKHFVLNGDGVTASVTNINGISTLAGTTTLTNSVIIWVNGSGLTNSGVISGNGSLTKLGGSPLVLTANETYTGNTTVRNGSIVLQGSAAISGSTNITVLAGATVDVSSRVNTTLTLNSGQTLQGNGTVSGILTAGSGSIISPGTNGVIGRLAVTGDAGLNGTLNMKLDKGNATNDVLSVGGQITYGGTLNLNNLSGALAANDQFKLFNAGTYSGSFANITPANPNNDVNLNWDTSSLAVNGILKVTSVGPPPQAHITGISLSGTTLTITATNGSASGQYVLLSSTNVALPLAQWTPVLTNNFDGGGNLNLSTNVIHPADAQTFYILKQ